MKNRNLDKYLSKFRKYQFNIRREKISLIQLFEKFSLVLDFFFTTNLLLMLFLFIYIKYFI